MIWRVPLGSTYRCSRVGGAPSSAVERDVAGNTMSKRIDPKVIAAVIGTKYPQPHDAQCWRRERKRLGDLAGLTQFGVNLLRLQPGVWSSQRHWHTAEDEFVYVLEGEVVLVTDGGEEILRTGDAAGFPAGDKNGHCLQNRSDRDAQLL